MGKSLIISDADFFAVGIRADGLNIFRSVMKPSVIRVAEGHEGDYGGFSDVLIYDPSATMNFIRHVYCVDVRGVVGRDISIKSCNGYGQTMQAWGGFIGTGINSITFMDGWTPPIGYTPLSFISTVFGITSAESNVWVTKTYTVPQGAKYLLFTSKSNNDGMVDVELVEEGT